MFELKNANEDMIEIESGSVLNVLKRWEMHKGAVAAKINGRYVDLSAELAESGLLEAIDGASEEGLDIIRHSAAHLMAQAFQSLYPEAHFGIGPYI